MLYLEVLAGSSRITQQKFKLLLELLLKGCVNNYVGNNLSACLK